MNRLRRATALVLSLLLVQLVLVGSGFTCIPDGGSPDAAMLEMGMGGMPAMAGMPAPNPMPLPDSPTPGSDPCNLPWAPGGCTLMIPCAPHAVTAPAQTIGDGPGPSHAVVVREIGTPPSFIIALDTPPPRA